MLMAPGAELEELGDYGMLLQGLGPKPSHGTSGSSSY